MSELNEQLTQLPLEISEDWLPRFMFCGHVDKAEIAARQLFLSRLAGRVLNEEILRSLANPNHRIACALPGSWIRKLAEHEFRLSRKKCQILFGVFVTMCLVRGVARLVLELTRTGDRASPRRSGRFVQFLDLTAGNLPTAGEGEKFDVVSWYLGWRGKVTGLGQIRHTVRGQLQRDIGGVSLDYIPHALPALDGFGAKLRYALWGMRSVVYASWAAACGRWCSAVLFDDLVLARKVALVGRQELAAEYLFSCSGIIKRPFWTYVAEEFGSKVTLYYYSAGLKMRFSGVPPHHETGFQSMTWPRVLQFSEHQQAFTRASVSSSVSVQLVPPISFSDIDVPIPSSSHPCVAVFDVSPVRMSYRALIVPEDDFRTVDVGIEFLDQLYSALMCKGYCMLWKRKRRAGSVHHKGYIRFADAFGKRVGVVEVHPDIAAARVIKSSVAAVSMPFTSTGLLAKYAGIPSVFYDPVGALSPDDPAALGVPLLSGVGDLGRWVEDLRQAR